MTLKKMLFHWLPIVIATSSTACAQQEVSPVSEDFRVYSYEGFRVGAESIGIIYADGTIEVIYGDLVMNASVSYGEQADTVLRLPELGVRLFLPKNFSTDIPFRLISDPRSWTHNGCDYTIVDAKPYKMPSHPSSYAYTIDSNCPDDGDVTWRYIYSAEYGLRSFFRGHYNGSDEEDQPQYFVAVEGYSLFYPLLGFGNNSDKFVSTEN